MGIAPDSVVLRDDDGLTIAGGGDDDLVRGIAVEGRWQPAAFVRTGRVSSNN